MYENDHILLLFLYMYSMKQFPGTFLKYLTKHEDDQLFWIVYESSDRGKVTETSMPLKKNGGERILQFVKKFITS